MTTGFGRSSTQQRIEHDTEGLVAAWALRNARIESWYTLRRLTDRWKQPGKTSFVSNRPKVYFNLARFMLATNSPRPRVMMASQDELSDVRNDAQSEHGILSIFRSFDDQHAKQGKISWRMTLADQILMGWVNLFCGVFKGDDGQPVFRADIWDNLTVFPEWDDDGISTVVHKYTASPSAAASKAKAMGFDGSVQDPFGGRSPIGGRSVVRGVEITDWWHRDSGVVWHAMTINGHEVVQLEEVENLNGEIPVLTTPVNGEARDEQRDNQDDLSLYKGVSVLEPIERTVNDFNDWATMVKQIARQTAEPNYIDYTEDGQGFLDALDMQRGGNIHHGFSDGDRAEVLPPPQLPSEVGGIFAVMATEVQLGSIPDTAFGDVAADTSGFLFSQLQAATMNNVGPFNEAQNTVMTSLGQRFVEGFRDGDFEPIRISARTNPDANSTGFFYEDWDPSKIDEKVWVDVRTQLAFMRNRLQEITMARQANPESGNLFDETSLLDEVLQVEDPLLIQQRKAQDRVALSEDSLRINQVIYFRNQAKFHREQGNRIEARAFSIAAQRIEAQLGITEQGQGQGQGQGQPLPGGIPPQVGGVPGTEDILAAAMGTPPPESRPRQ
jgi:hypothetical protein